MTDEEAQAIAEALAGILPGDDAVSAEDVWDLLRHRITVLSARAWEGRNRWPDVERWLANFDGRTGCDPQVEKLHALFLLSQFLYIGTVETRVLLRAIFRDLFLGPLVQEIRTELGGTRDELLLFPAVAAALAKTRFLGVGNVSESGAHLLYLFRQENELAPDQFIDASSLFAQTERPDSSIVRSLGHPDVERYIFIDDVCGSARTAKKAIAQSRLADLVALKKDVKLHYLTMVATQEGLSRVRGETLFGERAAAVFELDTSYRCLSERSRYLHAAPAHIDAARFQAIVRTYGEQLLPAHPCGYEDGQLLLGFGHNTPDNTVPVIWAEASGDPSWYPAFKRHQKL